MPDAPRATAGRRLRELDVVRVVTFASVVAVHVLSRTSRGDVVLGAVLILVHFTREVFFALIGWLQVSSLLRTPQPMRRFWPRRFLLVGVPYLTWSAIYVAIGHAGAQHPALSLLRDFGLAVLTGTAYYHMYFLLVTMQIYLLAPLIVRLIVATRRHHLIVLAVAMGLQVAKSALDAYLPGSLSLINVVSSVLNYTGFIMGGAVAADHADQVLAWVRRNRRAIGVATAAAALVTLGVYALQLILGFNVYRAATAYQPVVIGWSVAIGTGLLAAGTWWVDRRGPDAEHRLLDYLSDRSFGVFLAHPLVLWVVLTSFSALIAGWPAAVAAVLVYAIVVVGALLIADLARRSPLSLALAGRPRQRRDRARPRA